MDRNKQIESKKMCLLYFLRYFSDGCVYGFLPCYFLLAFTDTLEVGILLASIPLSALLGNIIIGKLSKNEKRNLFLLKIFLPIESCLICSIGFVNFSFALTLIFSIIGNFFSMSMYNLLDAIAGDINVEEHSKFSSMRCFGSLGYMFGALIIGFIVKAFQRLNISSSSAYGYGFICILPIYLLLMSLTYWMKPYDLSLSHPETKNQSYSYKDLFKNKNFVLYAIIIAFLIGGLLFADNIYTDYWNLGNTEDNNPASLGMSTALYEAIEFITSLIVAALISSSNLKAILSIGISASVLRFLGLGVCTYIDVKSVLGFGASSIAILMATNSLRGIVFGCFASTFVPFLNEIVGIKLKTPGVFIVTMSYGLINGIGQLVFKYMINGFKFVSGSSGHYPSFFLLAAIMTLLLLILPFIKFNKKVEEAK